MILRKKNQPAGFTLSDFKTHYEAMKQYGTSTKTDIQTNGTKERAQKNGEENN